VCDLVSLCVCVSLCPCVRVYLYVCARLCVCILSNLRAGAGGDRHGKYSTVLLLCIFICTAVAAAAV